MARNIHHAYGDPLDLVWLSCAEAVGMAVARSDEVFASWDGAGTLTISVAEHFDPDDSLAQLLLHELCHHLVEGPASWRKPDWGLENVDDRHSVREHAAHRLQAALTDGYGLRAVLAPTTDHRSYYDRLPPDPLRPGDDPAIPLAREGWIRATRGPHAEAIARALQATAAIARAVHAAAPPGSLWSRWQEPHPLGLPAGPSGATCAGCAWLRDGTCLQAERASDPSWPACARFEPPLTDASCGACAACCREGFHLVPVEEDEPCALHHPELLVRDDHGAHLPRPGGRCVALDGFRCRIYAERPRNCAELEPGGEHCLAARRRVGLSW